MRLKVWSFLFWLLIPVCTEASQEDGTKVHQLQISLSQMVEKYHQRQMFHGNIIIATSQDILFEKSIGVANEEWQIPHSIESRFLIASLTKQFTAAAILLLAQEGKLHLDDLVGHHLPIDSQRLRPDNRDQWNQLTIEDLLLHRGGLIRDISRSPSGSPEIYEPNAQATLRRMLSEVSIFYRQTGSEGIYSNFGYFILGIIIEKISGQSFHQFLRLQFFNPLTMNSTDGYHEMKVIPKLAEGYHLSDGGRSRLMRRCCSDFTSYLGSHDLYSDASDLLKWMRALTSHKDLFPTHFARELFRPRQLLKGSEIYYGYGFMIDQPRGVQRVWHSGKEAGYTSVLSYLPDQDVIIILLSNRSPHNDGFSEAVVQKMHDEITDLFSTPLL